jgi:flagellar biosynthesis protein FlhA
MTPVLTTVMAQLRTRGLQAVGAPLVLFLLLAMVVVPLPPLALDLFFTLNIALSLVVLLAVLYALRPLDFTVFPTVLLIATLFRLALNVASTRVVLLNGHEGGDAAGKVIEAFGAFVIGGNYAVGFVVFAILTIINFAVITKGAGRVSEVSARFTLDAMPGKQMAIDADLNAGLLTREEAKAKREEVRVEADFYGAMDGASKFVKGDAVAGILILIVNLVGGVTIGAVAHGLSFGEAFSVYGLLTIGDGLVAQLPALLLSTAVAILVTRMSRAETMAQQMETQMVGDGRAVAMAAALLFVIGLVPGMPNLSFLFLAVLLGGVAYWLHQRAQRAQPEDEDAGATAEQNTELAWEDLPPVDALGLELGYRLIPLADATQGGELMGRIRGIRRKLSEEMGFLFPAVHVRDNLQLPPATYRILLHGVEIASAECHPDRDLALDAGQVLDTVEGIATRDPAFGMPAVWITPDQRAYAQSQGYTVVDAATVMATHLSQLLKQHAHELLGIEEAQALVAATARHAPKLVEDLIPKQLSLAMFAKVLQGLLTERIPVRNLRGILEALAEHAPRTNDTQALLIAVRQALARQIVAAVGHGATADLPVFTLSAPLEQLLQDALQPSNAVLEPGLADQIQNALHEHAQAQDAAGEPTILLVPGTIRATLARFLRAAVPQAHVLAFHELPETARIRHLGTIG